MDPRAGVTPSIRNFAHAIDRQRQALERIPLLDAARPDVVEVALALDEAEAAAVALAAGADDLARFTAVARAVSIPVLRADFLTEEFRIYESRTAGADAVMFRASALPPEMLARLVQAATSTHMAACVACASAEEIGRAAAARAPIVALDPSLLRLRVPPRTLVLALSFVPDVRGRADAALDQGLSDAVSLRRALEEEDE
jgi:indole-3-glycerol phosphate synthase